MTTSGFWFGLALIVGINVIAGSLIIGLDYVLRLRMDNEQLRATVAYITNTNKRK